MEKYYFSDMNEIKLEKLDFTSDSEQFIKYLGWNASKSLEDFVGARVEEWREGNWAIVER